MRLTISIASPVVATLYALGIAAEVRDGFGIPTPAQRRSIIRRFRLSTRAVADARVVLEGYALWRWVKVGCLRTRDDTTLDAALARALTVGAKPIASLLRRHIRPVATAHAEFFRRQLRMVWQRDGASAIRWMRQARLHPPERLTCAIVPGLDDLGEAVPGTVVLGDRFQSPDFAFAVVCEEILHLALASSTLPGRVQRLFSFRDRSFADEVIAGYFLVGFLRSLRYPPQLIDRIAYQSYGRGRWVRALERRWGARR